MRGGNRFPRLQKLVWFNVDNTASEKVDWRLESSPATVEASRDCDR